MLRVLLATHHLANWSGSELVIIELMEGFLSCGHSVDVLSTNAASEFVAAWKPGLVRLFSKFEDVPSLSEYDIVYCQHSMLLRLFPTQSDNTLFGSSRPLFVYNHLSPYERFELPAGLSEALTADLILANSPETAKAIASFGRAYHNVEVMPNPAPISFAVGRMPRTAKRLERLLVVSNHLPPEALEAINGLSSHGVDVQKIGLPDKSRRLSPEDLHSVDAVMTIGKTVQYAVRAACPVYIYDHFGGPGWLTSENFTKVEAVNFSGRDTPGRKTAQEITHDLLELPETAVEAVAECPHRFQLENWIERLVALAERPRTKRDLSVDVRHFSQELLRCEENVLRHVDNLYDHAEKYMVAYQKCSEYAETMRNETSILHQTVHDQEQRLVELAREADEVRAAYSNESERSASLLAAAERYRSAYDTESSRRVQLASDVDRYRVAYESEAERSRKLLADAERFRTAYNDESERSASFAQQRDELNAACVQASDELQLLRKETATLQEALKNKGTLSTIIARLHTMRRGDR
jgi:uncharacterized coiled-coil DUF342 family protein